MMGMDDLYETSDKGPHLRVNVSPAMREMALNFIRNGLREKAAQSIHRLYLATYEANPHLDTRAFESKDSKTSFRMSLDLKAAMNDGLNSLIHEIAKEHRIDNPPLLDSRVPLRGFGL